MLLKFEVDDIVGKILDEFGVIGYLRPFYRIFARKLIALKKRGRTIIKVRKVHACFVDKVKPKLPVKVYYHKDSGLVTVWFRARNYIELREACKVLWGLDETIMDTILEEMNKRKIIHLI